MSSSESHPITLTKSPSSIPKPKPTYPHTHAITTAYHTGSSESRSITLTKSPSSIPKPIPTCPQEDGGTDELLAVLGYQVRASDMVEVAQKLELLKDLMGNAQGDGLSHLAIDLSTWLQSMLTELNPLDPLVPPHHQPPPTILDDSFLGESSNITSIDFTTSTSKNNNNLNLNNPTQVFDESSSSDYDLKAIPGQALYSQPQIQTQTQIESPSSREHKRLKPLFDLISFAFLCYFFVLGEKRHKI
ncbi:hypothetical protein ACB092_10G153800 [Castanea dentata]